MIGHYFHSTFSSLKIRNYRLYFFGQVISISGTFMQQVAQGWLVLKLTSSGTALGVVLGLQYLPILLIGPYGGLIADRFSKRRLMLVTQASFGLLAFILGVLVYTNLIQLWMLYIIAFCYGLTNAFDSPARQTFVIEMVGKEKLRNALTLYVSGVNMARIIGPSIAGILIIVIGLAPCFLLNAFSYVVVIVMILLLKKEELQLTPRAIETKGQIKEGLNYVRSNPVLLHVLLMMTVVGTLTYEFQVSLPIFAKFTFLSNAQGYGILYTALGIGGVIGGLISAGQKQTKPFMYVLFSFLFGIAVLVASFMPTLLFASLSMIFVGMCSIVFTSLGNTLLQLESRPEMRGRVMSLWAIAYAGSTTIGGPIIGWIGQIGNPRVALATGAVAAFIAGGWGAFNLLSFRFSRLRMKK